MNDTDNNAASYEGYRETLKKANELNKTAVFDTLTDENIERVTVNFDGDGDSGQIQDIEACIGGAPASVPEIQLTFFRADYSTGKLDSKESGLREAIETLCYGYLAQEQGGWENNDGAFGEFVFDIASRTIDLEFNARFVDSTLFCHSF